MVRGKLEEMEVSDAVRRKNPGLFGPVVDASAQSADMSAAGVVADDDARCIDRGVDGDFEGPEKELQAACERWLVAAGYQRRTEKRILSGSPEMGWFVHMPKTRGNPIIMDLMVLGNDGRFLEVELKHRSGKVRPSQKALVEMGGAVLCRSLAAFARAVRDWEREMERDSLGPAGSGRNDGDGGE